MRVVKMDYATYKALRTVADHIMGIMRTYREQEARGSVDTPGGLEHMGDVWRQLAEWDTTLRTVLDPQLGAPDV